MCLAWAFRKGWLPRVPFAVPTVLIGLWLLVLAVLPDSPRTIGAYDALAPYVNEIATILFALLIVSVASLELRRMSIRSSEGH